jgi:hypothetical protein
MTYVAHITVPVVFHANTDEVARHIVAQLRDYLADFPVQTLIPSTSPEVSDYPDATLQEVLPYMEPRLVPVS